MFSDKKISEGYYKQFIENIDLKAKKYGMDSLSQLLFDDIYIKKLSRSLNDLYSENQNCIPL